MNDLALPLRPDLQGIEPYGAPMIEVPVVLNVNENPYAPSEAVIAEVARAVASAAAGANRYPDREFMDLRKDLGRGIDQHPGQAIGADRHGKLP